MADGCGDDECFGVVFGTFFAIWIGAILFALVIGVGFYIWTAISLQRFFRRVGVAETWAGWVPFFGTWRLLEVGGFPGWLSLLSLANVIVPGASLVTTVFVSIGMYRIDRAMGRSDGFVVLGILLTPVWAWMNGNPAVPYRPEVFAQSGWPPPRAGFGAVPPGTPSTSGQPYGQQFYGQQPYAQPSPQQQAGPQQPGQQQPGPPQQAPSAVAWGQQPPAHEPTATQDPTSSD